jgi:hypothetical protein
MEGLIERPPHQLFEFVRVLVRRTEIDVDSRLVVGWQVGPPFFIFLANHSHEFILFGLLVHLLGDDLSLGADPALPAISFGRVDTITDHHDFPDRCVGNHLLHELELVVSFLEVPLVKNHVHAAFAQFCSKSNHPSVSFLVRPGV